MEYLLLVVGFVLLIKGADLFVEGSSNIAKTLGVPSLIIGLTIVAFGTSAPEASVSIVAAMHNSNEIAVGNVVGSNICNLLLVLGVSAIFGRLKTTKEIVFKDYLFSFLAAIVLAILTAMPFINEKSTATISKTGGLILLFLLLMYLLMLLKRGLKSEQTTKLRKRFEIRDVLFFLVGIIAVIYGGNLVVDNATAIANNLGLSKHFIGLTIIAIGTSLPELVTSVVAVIKKEEDIAIGNVIGSNVFNIFFILGMSSLISPVVVTLAVFKSLIFLIIINLIIFIILRSKFSLSRKEGIFMFLLYIAYLIYLIYH